MEKTIPSLNNNNFIDESTRAIILKLAIYNPNIDSWLYIAKVE